MPQQIINLGATGSGAGGDSARTAFEKAIANFAELYIAALPGTAAQKAAARDVFGLGTAATRAAQTGLTDTTAGALMPVGAFGLGSQTVGNRAPVLADADSYTTPSGLYRTANTANFPFSNNSLVLMGATFGGGDGSNDRLFELDFVNSGAAGTDDIWYRRRIDTVWRNRVRLFHTGNILGAVSQTGGVPTGAIIESAANSNGRYTKFASGLLVCEHSISLSASSDVDWTFPAAFSATPLVFGQAGGGDRVLTHGATAPNAISAGSLRGWIISNGTRTSSGFSVAAIGRWY